MKYTIKNFRNDFPNDDVCLEYIFKQKYPDLVSKFYRVKGRKCFANTVGDQIHPLKKTIFEKSSTPLTDWLYAIYLFSASKNGVSAKELERQLGVTYKCAWRICNQIRKLMTEDNEKLSGEVEVDETYVGGKSVNSRNKKRTIGDKAVVFGAVEREGRVKAKHVISSGARVLLPEIARTVEKATKIYSDEWGSYKRLAVLGYSHGSVNHRENEYSKDGIHTNTIEGFWSQLKRSINGTYHVVSPKYLQLYVDEFAFRYNHRQLARPLFAELVARV